MYASSVVVSLFVFVGAASALFRPGVPPFISSSRFSLPDDLSLSDLSLPEDPSQLDAALNTTSAVLGPFTFDQPISHFPRDRKYAPHVPGTFKQRFWIEKSSYRPGGPVILLDSGEINGDQRAPFLTQGIVKILTNATGGLGIVLENRYYGQSYVTPDLSTDNLRFLDNNQGVTDTAYFAQTVVVPGFEKIDLRAPRTPWILYGGSYAGAKVAYTKVTYPNVFWGAISSSGVIKAKTNFWQYYNPIIASADPQCIAKIESAVSAFDKVMASNDTQSITKVKVAFGFDNVRYADDMASVLTWPLGLWQGINWDPSFTSDPSVQPGAWNSFCSSFLGSTAPPLIDSKALGALGALTRMHVLSICGNSDREACLGTHDKDAYAREVDLEQDWRLWLYQVCSAEGFYQTAAPKGVPTVVSQFYTVASMQRYCDYSFLPGQYNRVPSAPNTGGPNAYGGYNVAADRLAFIDGTGDPWVGVTAHSPEAPKRPNTILRPYYLIPGGVHHWDENSLPGGLSNPALPPEIRKVQTYERDFVVAWLQDFRRRHPGH